MTEAEVMDLREKVRLQAAAVRGLRATVYAQNADPSADDGLLEKLVKAEEELHQLEQKFAPVPPPAATTEPPPPTSRPRLLGPDTTELKVETKLCMQPLPTGIYHLLDPEKDPLLTVSVANLSTEPRRVRVTVYLEGLSAQAVKTVELKTRSVSGGKITFPMHPTLLPERARQVSEVQWATLHVIADVLGNTVQERDSNRSPFAELCESHNTYPVLCLSRTSSFNSVLAADGARVDLSRYYGAWVTPHAEAVQERVRRAAELSPDKQIWGYQGERDSVARQVKALYLSLREAGVAYVNSVTDYGAAAGHVTQRTRLPRESLAQKSANCIDGTVLLASLLEGASLNPAVVMVPGHAFLGWQAWPDSPDWSYLETTMIGTAEFEAACASGKKQYDKFSTFYRDKVRRLSVADLRRDGIYPME